MIQGSLSLKTDENFLKKENVKGKQRDLQPDTVMRKLKAFLLEFNLFSINVYILQHHI